MKKVLTLMIVCVLLSIPMSAFAGFVPTDGVGVDTKAGDYNQSFYMFPVEAAAEEAETAVELPAIDPAAVIPAAGPAVFAGLSAVMALLGCALIPKK